jgi:hypothetical protein
MPRIAKNSFNWRAVEERNTRKNPAPPASGGVRDIATKSGPTTSRIALKIWKNHAWLRVDGG